MSFEHVTTPHKPSRALGGGAGLIKSIDEYKAATERARELADYPEGTPQADEMAGLVQAIMEWDKAHDDVTSWH